MGKGNACASFLRPAKLEGNACVHWLDGFAEWMNVRFVYSCIAQLQELHARSQSPRNAPRSFSSMVCICRGHGNSRHKSLCG